LQIHSFDQLLFSAYPFSGSVLNTEDTIVQGNKYNSSPKKLERGEYGDQGRQQVGGNVGEY
jgi:hypothetical protein